MRLIGVAGMAAGIAVATGCAGRFQTIPKEGPLRAQLESTFDCVVQVYHDAGYERISVDSMTFHVAASTRTLGTSTEPGMQTAIATQAAEYAPTAVAIPYALDNAGAKVSIDRTSGHVVVDAGAYTGASRDINQGFYKGPASMRGKKTVKAAQECADSAS